MSTLQNAAAALTGIGAVALGATYVYAAPRYQVAVPAVSAAPEKVVSAYLDALHGRDYATANALTDNRLLRRGLLDPAGVEPDLAVGSAMDVDAAESIYRLPPGLFQFPEIAVVPVEAPARNGYAAAYVLTRQDQATRWQILDVAEPSD